MELELLQPRQQHTLMRITEDNICVRHINEDTDILRGGRSKSDKTIIISLKVDKRSIALTHNLVFHSRTKHIDIQHDYICDDVASKKIEQSYI